MNTHSGLCDSRRGLGCNCNLPRLAEMQRWHVAVVLAELGRQLAIAAGLTRAHVNGYNLAAYETGHSVDPSHYWAPGCQRRAP
jgi:hypothetical protein